MLLRIEGSAPGATVLKLRLVDEAGALPGDYTFPEAPEAGLTLPGSILVKLGDSASALGVFLWAENAAGKAVAHVRSRSCYRIASGSQNDFTLELQAAPAAFTSNAVEDCRCQGDGDMCAAPSQTTGGSGGNAGTGGTGGTFDVAGMAGSTGGLGGGSSSGGFGGSTTGIDAGSFLDASAMGGSTPDAAAPTDVGPVVTNEIFGFEKASDWTSQEAQLSLDTQTKSQGAASLKFTAGERVFVRSRPFATNEVAGVTSKLALDVHVSSAPGSSHNIQLWFQCEAAAVYNAYVEYRSLANLQPGWHQIVFSLPASVVTALGAQHAGCQFWFQHEAPGTFRYDNMGFVP